VGRFTAVTAALIKTGLVPRKQPDELKLSIHAMVSQLDTAISTPNEMTELDGRCPECINGVNTSYLFPVEELYTEITFDLQKRFMEVTDFPKQV
jgi:hypothetical protein